MSQRAAWIVAAILVTVGVGCFFWWRGLESRREAPVADPAPTQVATETAGETLAVELYFPGEGGRLYPEPRELAVAASRGDQLTLLVEALLSGPRREGLRPAFPDGTAVAKVYLQAGDVYVDLISADGGPPPSTGSQREMLTVYSLVDSLVFNFEDVRRVALLWNGSQPLTFGGHLDTTRPLGPNPDLIAR